MTGTVVPRSTLARTIDAARNLIANSPTFQALVGASSEAGALAHIYSYAFEREDVTAQQARPFAVIGVDDETNYLPINQKSAQVYMNMSGGVWVAIQANVEPVDCANQTTTFDSYLSFLNFFGGITDDMSGLFFSDFDTAGFRGIRLIFEPERTPYAERGQEDYWVGAWMFEFNQGGN